LSPGALGNAVLVDPEASGRLDGRPFHSRAGRTPFADVDLAGWPVATVLRGNVAYQDGSARGPAAGRMVGFPG
jgi:dihydroorotase-like cyclic amidohydrolase